MFGGVPLYTHGTSDLSEAYKPRNTADEVYAQIIADLQAAQTELSPFSPGDQAIGKATSASATALLAKVYLQKKEWQKAAVEAKKVLDMNYFALLPDYENIVNPDFQNGKENVFSIQFGGNANSSSALYQTRLNIPFWPTGNDIAQWYQHTISHVERPGDFPGAQKLLQRNPKYLQKMVDNARQNALLL